MKEQCLVPWKKDGRKGPGRYRACSRGDIDVHLPCGPEVVPVCQRCLEELGPKEVLDRLEKRFRRQHNQYDDELVSDLDESDFQERQKENWEDSIDDGRIAAPVLTKEYLQNSILDWVSSGHMRPNTLVVHVDRIIEDACGLKVIRSPSCSRGWHWLYTVE